VPKDKNVKSQSAKRQKCQKTKCSLQALGDSLVGEVRLVHLGMSTNIHFHVENNILPFGISEFDKNSYIPSNAVSSWKVVDWVNRTVQVFQFFFVGENSSTETPLYMYLPSAQCARHKTFFFTYRYQQFCFICG
jgi:hypothetical protein